MWRVLPPLRITKFFVAGSIGAAAWAYSYQFPCNTFLFQKAYADSVFSQSSKTSSHDVDINRDRLRLFSGTANRRLADSVADILKVSVGELKVERFQDGEVTFDLHPEDYLL